MKILMLSASESIHTKRWCESLCKNGIEIVLFSFSLEKGDFYSKLGIKVYSCGIHNTSKIFFKVRYIMSLQYLKKIIVLEKPDIVHAHYASSYGFLGALSGFHPLIISVWGSDVYDFPNKLSICKYILKYSLSKADRILSTSYVMAKETGRYTNQHIEITPFGVDIALFKPIDRVADTGQFIVGVVKTLAPKYGIDVLIYAFARLLECNCNKGRYIVLHIVGDGPNRKEYEDLTRKLGISDKVTFFGAVQNEKLPEYYNNFSVSVSVSNSESFGVVAVEAMACECPVITSDADGFTEVVDDGVTGFIVPKKDVVATACAIQKFIDDPLLRGRLGKAGRERVKKLYDWNRNVYTMCNIYRDILKIKKLS